MGKVYFLQQALYHKVRHAIVVQPERFLDQQKIHLDLLVETHHFKVGYLSLTLV